MKLFGMVFVGWVLSWGQQAQASCACPAGFIANPNQTACYRTQTVAPSGIAAPQASQIGDISQAYYFQYPPALVTAVQPFPLNAHLSDTQGNNVSIVNGAGTAYPPAFMPTGASFNYWKNRVTGPNRISIKSVADLNGVASGWRTKAVCVNVPLAQKYTMHIGADNRWALGIDGSLFAKCTDVGGSNTGECFRRGLFIRHVIPAGPHIFELKYKNDGGPVTFWFELLKNDLQQVSSITQDNQVGVLFSTQSLQNLPNGWDYSHASETGNPHCPAGYAYAACAPAQPTCSRITYTTCQ